MRSLASYVGIALLCFMTVYGPLLHEHPAGELDGRGAVIHAHFPEPEQAPISGEPSIGFHHSHGKALWLDGFTTTTSDGLLLIAVVSPTFVPPVPEHRQFESPWVEIPRAHSPPSLDSRVPRSPPAQFLAYF